LATAVAKEDWELATLELATFSHFHISIPP